MMRSRQGRLGGFVSVLVLSVAIACTSDSGAVDPTPPTMTLPPPAAQQKLMPLGDSITQGNTQVDSYRRPLWHSLTAAGADMDFVGSQASNHNGSPPNPDFDVDNEGHWGWTADEVLAQMPGWAQAHQPDIALLHLGTNDMLGGSGIGSTLDELTGIVAALRAANPRVVVLLAQLIPTRFDEANERIVELNQNLASLAPSLSTDRSPVVLVDQFTGFDPSTMTIDGLHPNSVGEEHMSQRWLQALQPFLSTRRR